MGEGYSGKNNWIHFCCEHRAAEKVNFTLLLGSEMMADPSIAIQSFFSVSFLALRVSRSSAVSGKASSSSSSGGVGHIAAINNDHQGPPQ